jgi:macrophage erythroblast attacher
MLRYQQYIELVRPYTPAKLNQAIQHAQKWLYPYRSTHPQDVQRACGLLAVPPSRAGAHPAYTALYSPQRWRELADLFIVTHNRLLALPAIPSLHMALSAGLSALKTPACHSSSTQQSADAAAALVVSSSSSSTTAQASSLLSIQDKQQSGSGGTGTGSGITSIIGTSSGGGMCPICSRELNALAQGVPYAHHTKSHVEHDLVLLPNGRVYGRERLEEYARKTGGLLEGQVKDLRTGEVFDGSRVRRVYIT